MNYSSDSELMDLVFKSIVDALPCYVMIQDKDFNILFANQKLKSEFGDDIIGLSCYSVLKGSHHRCNICPIIRTFRDKKIHLVEDTIHLPDGAVIEIITYSAPLFDYNANVKACIKLMINEGALKEEYKELVTLGQSISLLSHDIKTVLEGLQGGSRIVEEGIKDTDQKLIHIGWDVVKKNISDITGITQNVLYSAKERKPIKRKASPVDVARKTGNQFAENASSLGIRLHMHLNPKVPHVKFDPKGISRMLGNLIWNSLQACQKDIQKSKHAIYIHADFYDDDHFMYEVEDNAGGMYKGTQQNLFKELLSSEGESGTGLGLMVVERIVRNHQGKIEVLTKTGKGSLFRTIFKLDKY
ncbi:MAG: GHKL domain-containing protein [Desulfobacteraceae bacterium]|nr:GHKL domain-containing protein [Desulfobacteraceae bacterium]